MPDYPAPPPVPTAAPSKTSGMAVTSLVLGILGLFTCGVTALVGLVFGIIAIVTINNSKGKLTGNGIALAGIIVSALFMFAIPVFAAMLLPVLATAKERAQTINCVNNEKVLALGVRMYARDHNNQLPPSATWCDAIRQFVGSERVFKCPSADAASRCDYAFNAALDGMDETKVDPQTVMIFESDGGWNASGGADSMVLRHQRGRLAVVAFADGSVEEVRQSQLGSLRWNP